MDNIGRFAQLIPGDDVCALIDSEVSRFYLTGFASDFGFLIVSKKGSFFLTDSRYIEAAREAVKGCEVLETAALGAQFSMIFSALGCSSILVEAERTTLAGLKRLRRFAKGYSVKTDGCIDAVLTAMRSLKTAREVALIEKAQALTDSAFDHILGVIKPGITEREVCLELDFFMLKNGADAVAFETIAASGVNGSKPHAVPGGKRLAQGEMVTLDFGAVCGGYRSDMTRTVALGKPGGDEAKVYGIVLEAQARALAKIADGVTCFDADAAGRDFIAARGYGACFGHGIGHGVGVEIHEEPRVSKTSKQALRAGNVVTVEPGIYLPGKFGVRIEDMVLVAAGGCRNLTASRKDLVIL